MIHAPEILDIKTVVARWDEIMDRAEAGEIFIISVDGEEKVRLEPIPPAARDLIAIKERER